MIVENEKLKHPHGNKKIWRYMDLPKFLDLVTSEELFFANSSTLSDKYEGELPLGNLKTLKRAYMRDKDYSEYQAQEAANMAIEVARDVKSNTLINCWSMNTIESFALWKIYLGSAGSGVGIRTNVKALRKSLSQTDIDIEMGEVSYRNYLENINKSYIMTRKSPFYKYEQELRLLIDEVEVGKDEKGEKMIIENKHPVGLKVPINVNELIQEIYISPFMGDWFEEMLRKTLTQINPSLVEKIRRSDIQEY